MPTQYFSDLPLPIAIIGLGVTGNSVLQLLLQDQIPASSILTFDEKSLGAQFNNSEELIQAGKPRSLIVSPGIALKTPWILQAKLSGISILSELSLAYRILKQEKIIAITGSVGKSTTTCLLKAALETFTHDFFVGGNLGIPLAQYSYEVLAQKRMPAEWVVLELSSYQLENFPELKSDLSIISYFTANHLERYSSKEEYYQTKWSLESHTKDLLILNQNGGDLKSWCQNKTPQCSWIWCDRNIDLFSKFQLKECSLLGSHNLDNIAMAATVIDQLKWPPSAFEGIKSFPGLPHRVENLGTHKGIRYINDSKATTIESVKIAVSSSIENLLTNNKLHLLLGGRDKNLPWKELESLKTNLQIQPYFFGESRSKIKFESQLRGEEYPTLLSAIQAAQSQALPGDSILLSPGGTSLDEFKNFEERGHFFKAQIVK